MKTLRTLAVLFPLALLFLFNVQCNDDMTPVNDNSKQNGKLNDNTTCSITIRLVIYQVYSPGSGDCPASVSIKLFDTTETYNDCTLRTHTSTFTTLDSVYVHPSCGNYYTSCFRIERYVDWTDVVENRHAFWAPNYDYVYKSLYPFSGGSYQKISCQTTIPLYCNQTYNVRWGVTTIVDGNEQKYQP